MITKINTDVTFSLNTLPHKLPSLDSIKLNAQMIMRSPIFMFLFTARPFFNNAVLKSSATKRAKSSLPYEAPRQLDCKLLKKLIYHFL